MDTKKDRKEIGRRLATYRRSKGLSQEQVAERAGLAVNYISRIETGASNATIDALSRVTRAMGAPLHAVISADAVAARKNEDEKLRREAANQLKTISSVDLRVLSKILRALG